MREHSRWTTWCLIIICGCLTYADGGIFPQFAESANSADQRAVIFHNGTEETLMLETARTGDAGQFAWVIPTPDRLTRDDISEASPRVFEELYYLTEPRAYSYGRNTLPLGCSGNNAAGQPQYAGVHVWDEFEVNDYQVSVLSAEDSANLDDWLTDNGYQTASGMEQVLDHYVNNNWYFVALKMNAAQRDAEYSPPDGQLGNGTGQKSEEFRPLQLTFASDDVVFPMRISQLSTQKEVSVLLYVFARHRVAATNFETTQVDIGDDYNGKEFPAYYETRLRQAVSSGSEPALAVEYAANVDDHWLKNRSDIFPIQTTDGYFLTRLRTFLGPEDMDDDIVFTRAATDREFSVRIASADTDTHSSPIRIAMIGLLLAGAIIGACRQGTANSHRLVLLCLTVAILLV